MSNNNNHLKRFQIVPSATAKGSEELTTARTKSLNEVQLFDAAGTFYLKAKVASVLFSLYKACPLRLRGGVPCRKKVDSENYCTSCDHRAQKPLQNLYMRIVLVDCVDKECEQQTTAFAAAAIAFLGIKSVDAFAKLAETAPETLEAILQSKIDETVLVKLNLKEKNSDGTLDWIISSILVDKPAEVVVVDLVDDASDSNADQGDVSHGGSPAKRTKKN